MGLASGAPEGQAVPVNLCKPGDGIADQLRDIYSICMFYKNDATYKW
jgi:hypothetical protein